MKQHNGSTLPFKSPNLTELMQHTFCEKYCSSTDSYYMKKVNLILDGSGSCAFSLFREARCLSDG